LSSRGVADIVFCLDASASMKPCFEGVCRHLGSLLDGLGGPAQTHWEVRFEFVAYSASAAPQTGTHVFRMKSLRCDSVTEELYAGRQGRFFTEDADELRRRSSCS
jgi:hypothetical protein